MGQREKLSVTMTIGPGEVNGKQIEVLFPEKADEMLGKQKKQISLSWAWHRPFFFKAFTNPENIGIGDRLQIIHGNTDNWR
jgi:hypothetical protein